MQESQRLVNVINSRIDASVEDGAMETRTPGVVSSAYGSGYVCSVYVKAGDYVDDVIVPNGVAVSAGDYVFIAEDGEGKAWIDRLIPNSLYSKFAIDYERQQIMSGDGTSPASARWGFNSSGDLEPTGTSNIGSATHRVTNIHVNTLNTYGDATVNGNLNTLNLDVDGTLDLNNDGTKVTITSPGSGYMRIGGNVYPDTPDSRLLGSVSNRWGSVWSTNGNLSGTLTANSLVAESLVSSSGHMDIDAPAGYQVIIGNISADYVRFGASTIPMIDGGIDLGNHSWRWANGWFDEYIAVERDTGAGTVYARTRDNAVDNTLLGTYYFGGEDNNNNAYDAVYLQGRAKGTWSSGSHPAEALLVTRDATDTTSAWWFQSNGGTSFPGGITVRGNLEHNGLIVPRSGLANFELRDDGVSDSTAVRVFSSGGKLYLQMGDGDNIHFRDQTGAAIATFSASRYFYPETSLTGAIGTTTKRWAEAHIRNVYQRAPVYWGYKSTGQTANNGSLTDITFGSAMYDPLNMDESNANNTYLRLNRTGLWFIMMQLEFAANNNGYRQLALTHNNSQNIGVSRISPYSGSATIMQVSGFVESNSSSDYVRFRALQNSGANLGIGVGLGNTFRAAYWLGDDA